MKVADADVIEESLTVTVPMAARLLGISISTCWRLIYSGELPTVRIVRRRLVTRSAIEHFLADAAIAPGGAEDMKTAPGKETGAGLQREGAGRDVGAAQPST